MASRGSFLRGDVPVALALLIVLGCVVGCAGGTVLPPTPPACGDGAVQDGEACDDGSANSDTAPGACRSNCVKAACGDGVTDPAEVCDDGNAEAGDGCNPDCTESSVCGDMICDLLMGEECSVCAQDCCICGDGTCDTSFGETCAMCPSECCPACGDGKIDPGEECDDGNNTAGDGCGTGCDDEDEQATCGNGFLEAGEECDDGNSTTSDGCSAACVIEFTCGDETCDAMAGETCQLCQKDCCPDCGDGIIGPGEECDMAALDGVTCANTCYDGGTLVCTPYCTFDFSVCTGDLPVCGDGVADACNEECDGQDVLGETCGSLGFAPGTLSCSATCVRDTSACGVPLYYLNENFDNGCPPPGWTLGGDWQCGTPTNVGPSAAYSAPACLGTQIASNYSPSQSWDVAVATTPPIDLTTASEVILSMRSWVDTEGSTYDGYNIKISTDGGASYTRLTTVSPPYNLTIGGEPAWGGHQSALGWQPVTANLGAYVGQTIRLRLAFRSDPSVHYPGVYIDNLFVAETSSVPLAITTPVQLPTATTNMLYQAQPAKSGGSASSVWSIVGGMNHAWLSINPATGQLTGTPTFAQVGPVSVTVHVEEPMLPSNFAEKTFTFNVIHVFYQTSFEACPDGWALTSNWECGVPTVVGPASAHDGTRCLGTKLSAHYDNGLAWGSTTATSPVINLANAASATLSFRMWVHTEGLTFDGANLKISVNGSAFTILNNVTPAYNVTLSGESAWGGNQSALGWQAVSANLAAYLGQKIQLQFSFRSDGTFTLPGVYIDHVRIQ